MMAEANRVSLEQNVKNVTQCLLEHIGGMKETEEDKHRLRRSNVFFTSAAVVSKEMSNEVKDLQSSSLDSMATKHKLHTVKMQGYDFIFGDLDELFDMRETLLQNLRQHRRQQQQDKPQTALKVGQSDAVQAAQASTPCRKRPRREAEPEPEADPPSSTRTSSRLSRKTRKSYATLHTGYDVRAGDDGDATVDGVSDGEVIVKIEPEEGEEENMEEEKEEEKEKEEGGKVNTPSVKQEKTDTAESKPGKRKRGRPRKHPVEPDADKEDSDTPMEPSKAQSSRPKKSGSESGAKVNSSIETPKRGRGRPRKVKKREESDDTGDSDDNSPGSLTQKCGDCDRKFSSSRSLRLHARAVHEQGTADCDVCFRTFISASARDQHRRNHFSPDGHALLESAILVHLQALERLGKAEDNLEPDLIRQVEEYQEQLKLEQIPKPTVYLEGEPVQICSAGVVSDMGSSFSALQARNAGAAAAAAGAGREDAGDTETPEKEAPEDGEDGGGGGGGEPKKAGKRRGRKWNSEKGVFFPKEPVNGDEETDKKLVECDVCHAKLTSAYYLQRHVDSVHGPQKTRKKRVVKGGGGVHQCPHCDFACQRIQNFTRHLNSHKHPDFYMCDQCDYRHKQRAEVLRHKRNTHAEKLFCCEQCGVKHRNQVLLNMHIKMKHSKEYSRICELCGKVLNTRTAYRAHVEREHGDDEANVPAQLLCNLCGRVLRSKKMFDDHLTKFHNGAEITMETRVVNEGVNWQGPEGFLCKYCDSYSSKNAREVRRHIIRKHMERKYSCEQCNSSFPLEKLLIKHVRSAHYGLDKRKCQHCNKWFRNNSYLMAHLKRVHSLTKAYTCTVCGRQFADKRTYESHCDIHKPVAQRSYKYTCETCQKKFRSKGNYDYHVMEHTGQRPFPCGVCPQTFRTQSVLSRHLTTHSSERPHACPQCGKAFKLKKYLDVHQLTHENKYACAVCWRAFGSQELEEKHICKAIVMREGDGGGEAAVDGASVVHVSTVVGATGTQSVVVVTKGPNAPRMAVAGSAGVGAGEGEGEGEVEVKPAVDVGGAEAEAGVSADADMDGGEGQPGGVPVGAYRYMCAVCAEGFVDVETASEHVCTGQQRNAHVTEEDRNALRDAGNESFGAVATAAEAPAGVDEGECTLYAVRTEPTDRATEMILRQGEDTRDDQQPVATATTAAHALSQSLIAQAVDGGQRLMEVHQEAPTGGAEGTLVPGVPPGGLPGVGVPADLLSALDQGEESQAMEMYMCGVCNNLFATPEEVQLHLQLHVTADGRMIGEGGHMDGEGEHMHGVGGHIDGEGGHMHGEGGHMDGEGGHIVGEEGGDTAADQVTHYAVTHDPEQATAEDGSVAMVITGREARVLGDNVDDVLRGIIPPEVELVPH